MTKKDLNERLEIVEKIVEYLKKEMAPLNPSEKSLKKSLKKFSKNTSGGE